ncbi:MAG: tyrosine--tRNA ligase [Candidatus Nomurabacteria bacterium]
MKKINDELLTRGIASIYPSKEFLESKIKKGEKLTIYLGIDPTGPTLHLGHAIPIKKLSEFQKDGHKIILLMGDFTAMIGDPTDKGAARKQLTHKEVMLNLKNYKKQASSILSFTGKNAAQFKFNSKWLSKMNFEKVLSLASNITVQQMLERDMFEKRMNDGKPIYLHEFMYPLMQGYDSVAMDVDGEIGGNDQTFNMLCGRDLMKTMKNKEKFVITVKLLEDNSGKKMGKTEGNMVSLSDTPNEMFGKVMSWTDGLIIPGFELCTNISTGEIEDMKKMLDSGNVNPKEMKVKLANEVVKMFHGDKKSKEAQGNWEKTFSKKEIPIEIESILVKEGTSLVDVLISQKIVSSKNEFRRLIGEGAITNMDEDQKVSTFEELAKSGVYKIGKKRFCKIKISD